MFEIELADSQRMLKRAGVERWSTASPIDLAGIRAVCLDIDDTLSTDGKLTAEAFASLWELRHAGFCVVPVTGRSAGWCDQIARFWPVDAVVGENGAFTFFMQGGVRRRLDTLGLLNPSRDRLKRLAATICKHFPQAHWSSDQSYREFDLAVDLCEDVPAWDPRDLRRLVALCDREGAQTRLSSIHLNIWYGDYDKRRGIECWWAHGAPGLRDAVPEPQEWLFIGDSPNDEPLFGAFRCSVGVANLAPYLPQLRSRPRWLTDGRSGAGFCEMVSHIVSVRPRTGVTRSYPRLSSPILEAA
jgi:HAD superfamily hydrolase (TIGR01484 family)